MSISLPRCTYAVQSYATKWEVIWEASSYYEHIANQLEASRNYAVFVGWQVDSRLRFQNPKPETLREKILRICREKPEFQFYFLIWDHAFFYCSERELLQGLRWLKLHPRVHFVLDNRHPYGSSHHEKIVILDGKISFCGGIDFCDARWDTPQHYYFDSRRSLNGKKERHGPYHDLAVKVQGSICGEIQNHVRRRWEALSAIPFPPNSHQPQLGHSVYLSRTLANIDALPGKPLIIREIEHLFRSLLWKAQNRILIEEQYYWSQRLNELLISKMKLMTGKKFSIRLILCDLAKIKSLTRVMSGHQLKLLTQLKSVADQTKTNLVISTPTVLTHSIPHQKLKPKSVYIHSKLLIIDDRFISIGSANFANRALRLDSELQLTLEAKAPEEKHDIDLIYEQILGHWEKSSQVILRHIKPDMEFKTLVHHHPLIYRIPWQIFCDPKGPWSYYLKRFFQKKAARISNPFYQKVSLLILVGFDASLTMSLSSVAHPWAWFYALLLSGSWIFPVPYFFILVVAGIHLGPISAPPIVFFSFCISAIIAYFLGRVFPSFYTLLFPESKHWKSKPKTFSSLLKILFNPKIKINLKLAFPGLAFIPFLWFMLSFLILFPGILFLVSKEAGELFHKTLWNYMDWAGPLICIVYLIKFFRKETFAGESGLEKNKKYGERR